MYGADDPGEDFGEVGEVGCQALGISDRILQTHLEFYQELISLYFVSMFWLHATSRILSLEKIPPGFGTFRHIKKTLRSDILDSRSGDWENLNSTDHGWKSRVFLLVCFGYMQLREY